MSTSTSDLEKRRAQLLEESRQREREQEEVARIDAELGAREDAERVEAAARRLLGVARAHGSLFSELQKDQERIIEARRAYVTACTRENVRRRKLATLELEWRVLLARWPEATAPALTVVPPYDPTLREVEIPEPGRPPRFTVDGVPSDATEEERRRAVLKAIKATVRHLPPECEGRRLIEQAGFPDLTTEREREIAARREAQRAREAAEMAGLAEVAEVWKGVGY